MIKYIGIDLSLCETGIAVISDDVLMDCETIKTGPRDSFMERCGQIVAGISKYASQEGTYMATESPIMHMKGTNNLCQLWQLFGIVRYRFRFIDYYTPTAIKKYVTGKGNAKKDVMMLEIYRKWGEAFKNNNIADAYAIAKLYQAVCNAKEGRLPELKYEIEVIKKIIS